MVTENTLIKFGFIKEENDLRLKEMINGNSKLKEVYIDMYSENPFISSNSFSLLLRTSENNASIFVENDRLVLKKNDMCGTLFMNVPISKISECFSKINKGYSEFILNVQNIYYKITILN